MSEIQKSQHLGRKNLECGGQPKTAKHPVGPSTVLRTQQEDEEEYDRLQNEAINLFADTVTEVGSFPKADPEEIERVWLEVEEKLFAKLLPILTENTDANAIIEVIRLIKALEVTCQTFSSIRERAKAFEQIGKVLNDDLTENEKMYRLMWRLSPQFKGDPDGQNVTDDEAKYIRTIESEAELGVRSISRIMGRSSETIHRVLKQK